MFVARRLIICNHYGKTKTGSEADHIKQSCWAEAEMAEAGKIISTKRYGIFGEPPQQHAIVSVKTKILATLRKAGEYIYSSEILFHDCLSKVRVKFPLERTFQNVNAANGKTSIRLTLERKRLNGTV